MGYPPMWLYVVLALLEFAILFLAGYYAGKATMAPQVARLVAEIEIARQTGVIREKRSLLDLAVGRGEPKHLDGSGGDNGTRDGAQAAEEAQARAAMVAKGAEKILADARANGISISPSEARRMAEDMVSEVL